MSVSKILFNLYQANVFHSVMLLRFLAKYLKESSKTAQDKTYLRSYSVRADIFTCLTTMTRLFLNVSNCKNGEFF